MSTENAPAPSSPTPTEGTANGPTASNGSVPADADSHAVAPSHVAPDGTASQLETERARLNDARSRGRGAMFKEFVKQSGPGWLQSAITLGGGSLTASLYLGVLGGYDLLWLQPLAMLLGIVMLSAIAYVTLSTRRRPFEAIKNEISPALAWAWLLASMAANFVWCMPQYALGTAALRQNLLPGVFGAMSDTTANLVCVGLIFALAGIVGWFYESGGRGVKIFERLLKVLVMIVVVSFISVVVQLLLRGELNLGTLLGGFVPDFSLLTSPGREFRPLIEAAGDSAGYWESKIVGEQQSVMIAAFATAVGINMTFLLPYSMLARGWDRDFRGLAIFDLSTSLLLPFLLATTCVIVAAASRFHATPANDLHLELTPSVRLASEKDGGDGKAAALTGGYLKLLDERLAELEIEKDGDAYSDAQRQTLPEAERLIAASLVRRDAGHLAGSLGQVFGDRLANVIFGIGVLAMAVSTVIILMLINGFVFCEAADRPGSSFTHRLGAFAAGLVGCLGPFVWKGDAKLWLAVPTSEFGAVLLPIAYLTFFAMMNSRRLLGDAMPTGGRRLLWNLLMGLSCLVAVSTSLFKLSTSNTTNQLVGFGALGVILLAFFLTRKSSGDHIDTTA